MTARTGLRGLGCAASAGVGLARVLACVFVLSAATPLFAQGIGQSLGTVQSPILTLNEDRLFSGSMFGQRVLSDISREQDRLVLENRALETELTAEERDLTERREALDPEEFRALADSFDARVEQVRTTQDAKARALSQRLEAERQRFFEAALPVLGGLVRDAGAVAILSDQAIVLSFESIDITDLAIERLNAVLGTGEGAVPQTPEPQQQDPAPQDPTPQDPAPQDPERPGPAPDATTP